MTLPLYFQFRLSNNEPTVDLILSQCTFWNSFYYFLIDSKLYLFNSFFAEHHIFCLVRVNIFTIFLTILATFFIISCSLCIMSTIMTVLSRYSKCFNCLQFIRIASNLLGLFWKLLLSTYSLWEVIILEDFSLPINNSTILENFFILGWTLSNLTFDNLWRRRHTNTIHVSATGRLLF